MELSVLLSPIVSAIIAVFGAYAATKKASDDRERDYANSIARLEVKLDMLADTVEKHNSIVERTYKLESDVKTAFKRIDELREEVKK